LARAVPPQLIKTAVHGHVNADDTGAPLRGVKVTLIQQEFARKTVAMTTTDETGVFEFTGLSPGYYSVYFEKPGFVWDQVFDALANEITVHLRRTGSISGRVLDRDGEPLEKVLVEVMAKSYMYGDVSLHSRGFIRTDDQGMYRVAGLAPGRYYVRASRAG
jgi:protocatechuate 3,4-dioxygenase beta subunit